VVTYLIERLFESSIRALFAKVVEKGLYLKDEQDYLRRT